MFWLCEDWYNMEFLLIVLLLIRGCCWVYWFGWVGRTGDLARVCVIVDLDVGLGLVKG